MVVVTVVVVVRGVAVVLLAVVVVTRGAAVVVVATIGVVVVEGVSAVVAVAVVTVVDTAVLLEEEVVESGSGFCVSLVLQAHRHSNNTSTRSRDKTFFIVVSILSVKRCFLIFVFDCCVYCTKYRKKKKDKKGRAFCAPF